MNVQFFSCRSLPLGFLLILAPVTLSACEQFTAPTAEAPTSPTAAVTPSPAAPAPTSPTAAVAPSPAAPAPDMAAPAAANTIAAVASGNPEFSTLVAALKAAGLVDALAQPGAFTVFAPTNAAFNALPPATVQALLRPENKAALTQILTYHVVPQKITAAQITSVDVPTLEGSPLKIRVDGGGVKINDASVAQADVMASNGVIHGINQVILPPTFDPAQLK